MSSAPLRRLASSTTRAVCELASNRAFTTLEYALKVERAIWLSIDGGSVVVSIAWRMAFTLSTAVTAGL